MGHFEDYVPDRYIIHTGKDRQSLTVWKSFYDDYQAAVKLATESAENYVVIERDGIVIWKRNNNSIAAQVKVTISREYELDSLSDLEQAVEKDRQNNFPNAKMEIEIISNSE
jgi:hypothetical protein